MFFWDPTFILLIPGLLLAIWAQMKVKMSVAKWSKVLTTNNISGVEVAQLILDKYGIRSVSVRKTSGFLTDNYNPIKRTLNLSPGVYGSTSVAAVGVAAHEAGHAIQHNKGYIPLMVRNGIFPIANFGSWLAYPLFFLGWLFGQLSLMKLGIYLFTGFVVFTVITLPVEFNASRRAVKILTNSGLLTRDEIVGVKEVLTAAAYTYVAAALSAILNLLRLLILSGDRD